MLNGLFDTIHDGTEFLAENKKETDLDKAVFGNVDELNKTPLDALKDYLVDIAKNSDLVKRAQEAQVESITIPLRYDSKLG